MLPIEVLSHYSTGAPLRIKKISNGFVHTSYKVQTAKGTFLLQKLHPKLGTPAFTRSYHAVSTAMRRAGMASQQVLKDTKGRVHIPDGNTGWRLVTFVPGHVITGVPTPSQAKKLAFTLGKTHLALKTFPARNCSPMKMRQTKRIFSELKQTLTHYHTSSLMRPVRMQARIITNALPSLLFPKHIPQHTIHGDTKINNFVLLKGGEATMIDLDTCTHASPLLDLGEIFGGDALAGSWCRTHTSTPQFNAAIFKAGLIGYRNATKKFLSTEEQGYIVQATKLLVMELAARFLIDYFNDSYFGWDGTRYPTRRAHNLARVNAQIAFYKNIAKQEHALRAIVTSTFSR